MYRFETTQILPISVSQAWEFFSSAGNLSKITPPEMEFKIISKIPENGIYEGLQIDYIVKPLLGIPLHWKTEIGKTEVNHFFSDKQLKGPYKKWEHKHTFSEHPEGVIMTDVVLYQLPFGFIGKWAHRLFVKKKIESIFEYRSLTLNKLFS